MPVVLSRPHEAGPSESVTKRNSRSLDLPAMRQSTIHHARSTSDGASTIRQPATKDKRISIMSQEASQTSLSEALSPGPFGFFGFKWSKCGAREDASSARPRRMSNFSALSNFRSKNSSSWKNLMKPSRNSIAVSTPINSPGKVAVILSVNCFDDLTSRIHTDGATTMNPFKYQSTYEFETSSILSSPLDQTGKT